MSRCRRYTASDMARFMEHALGLPNGELDKPYRQIPETPLLRLIRKRAVVIPPVPVGQKEGT